MEPLSAPHAIALVAHLLLFVYWLGADVGVFYSSGFVVNPVLTREARPTAAKIMLNLDLIPRICMSLMLTVSGILTEFQTPIEARGQFFVFMCGTALFMPFSSPNVVATVFDITSPEVRSTAQSGEYFVGSSGAALAATIAGAVALATDKQTAFILSVCITAWALCFIFYLGALFFIGPDAQALRDQMRLRAEHQQSHPGAG